MSNFLDWFDISPIDALAGVCVLLYVMMVLQWSKHQAQLDAIALEDDAEKIHLRREVESAIEEMHVLTLQVDSLVRERDNLLQCNLELQQEILQRDAWIKYLSPYQVIRSRMPWGKN